MMRTWFLILPLAFVFACSYQPEDAGQCKLQCSSAIIAGNDPTFSIALKTSVPKTSCPAASAGAAVDGLRADWIVGESIFDQASAQVAVRPVPGISIEPVIVGNTAKIENGETNPAYQGVKTPRDNWCSDACGVISLQVVGLCPPAGMSNDVNIQLHSGALYGEAAVFSIQTEAPAEAAAP